MKRITDMNFFNCPICGKKPHVEIFNMNYGMAYCKGTFFKRHPLIKASTGYCNPSKLYETLMFKWNYSHLGTLNDY